MVNENTPQQENKQKPKAYIWSDDKDIIAKFKAVKNIYGDKKEFNEIVLNEGLKAIVNSAKFRTSIANLKALGI